MLLLSLHKAGELTTSQLCAEFPAQFSGIYVRSDRDKHLIIQKLQTLQEVADPADKRQIARLLRTSRSIASITSGTPNQEQTRVPTATRVAEIPVCEHGSNL